jgi:archaellum component FlaC
MFNYFSQLVFRPDLVPQTLVGVTISGLSLCFLWFFLRQAVILDRSLDRAIKSLRAKNDKDEWDLSECFEANEDLQHAWSEYAETLHKPARFDPVTQTVIKSLPRATVPAEAIFSAQQLIDPRLNVEFFRHLPGIFTGLGIIGTFLGLISGLQQFHSSSDIAAVQQSLNILLGKISEAFIMSLSAIVCAMIATGLEKFYYGHLSIKVDKIKTNIDARFESGAGEEYLARLVDASEGSLTQTKQLKDALVSELKALFEELTERQISAANETSQNLGQTFTEGQIAGAKALADHIADVLKGPLDALRATNAKIGEDQGAAVATLMKDIMAGFSSQIEKLFGSQLTDISQMQNKTIDALDAAARNLSEVSDALKSSGNEASDNMAKVLSDAMEAADRRQREMSDELTKLMAELSKNTGSLQDETQQKIAFMLDEMDKKITSSLSILEDQTRKRQADNDQAGKDFQTGTGETVDRMRGGLDQLLEKNDQVAHAVSDLVSKLDSVTSTLTLKLNSSTEDLRSSAESFKISGAAVTESFDKIGKVSGDIGTAASGLSDASKSLSQIVGDYKSARESFSNMVEQLDKTVVNATDYNSRNKDVLSGIENATARLAEAQTQAHDYLEDVSNVLEASHGGLRDALARTVGEANHEFHKQLTIATGLLKDAIEELDLALPGPPANNGRG